MNVKVNMFAHLVKYGLEGKNVFSLELDPGDSVKEIIRYLRIPPEEGKIILVNGKHCDEDKVLKEGDEVVLMTPVEGG